MNGVVSNRTLFFGLLVVFVSVAASLTVLAYGEHQDDDVLTSDEWLSMTEGDSTLLVEMQCYSTVEVYFDADHAEVHILGYGCDERGERAIWETVLPMRRIQ